MQSGYGMPDISRQQQNPHYHQQQQPLMDANDECCSSVFPIPNYPLQDLNFNYQSQQKQREQQMFLQHHQGDHQIHPFFQQQNHHHFRPTFQQDRLHSPPAIFPMKFKMGSSEQPNYSGSSKNETSLNHQQQQQQGAAPLVMPPHCWHPQEDSTSIKQSFWKELSKSKNEEQERVEANSKNNVLLGGGELEAIYSLAKIGEANETGSGSALTGENSPKNANLHTPMPFSAVHGQNAGVFGAADAGTGVDRGSENSIGEEALVRKGEKRVKRRKTTKEKLSSMAEFFETLVKQVMDHQEMLDRKFLEVIDRMDKERTEREEEWRKQEAARYNREAISRAHGQDLASSREAQIVSYIEKITGKSIDLPARKTPLLVPPEISKEPTKELTPANENTNTNSRWPKAEVEALIQVRTSIETKFQEPGLKGPLWEEVSSLMSSMGYQRSAKRCKEKWENINKYFRKAKESTKKRFTQSKTCSYFNQLDQIYSTRTLINSPSSNTCSMPLLSSSTTGVEKQQGYSEPLEAFIAGRDIATSTDPSNKNIDEMGTSGLDFNGSPNEEIEQRSHEEEKEEDHEEGGDDEEGSSDDNV